MHPSEQVRHTSPPPPPPRRPPSPNTTTTDPAHATQAHQGDPPPSSPTPINPEPAPPKTAPPLPDHRWYPPAFHPAYVYPPPHPYFEYRPMPHRVEADRHSGHHTDDGHYQRMHSQPTPPPIATLHHSPAMSTSSLASSSISPSPPVSLRDQRAHYRPHELLPDPHHHAYQLPQSAPYYPQHPSSMPAPAYAYAAQSAPSARYAPEVPPPSPYAQHGAGGGTGLMRTVRPSYGHSQPSYPGQPNYIIYTNDAATKLSDRVRRKCYNCHTTDTSTWRRSSLTPGKVLCNKCGLFERTHSRPRPDQFPHKRGPLVTASFKSSTRSPPPPSRLPPMPVAHAHAHAHQQQAAHVQAFPPHHANHASIAPLMSQREQVAQPQQPYYAQEQQQQQGQGNASTLPEIRSLLNTPAGGSPASSHEGMDGHGQPSQGDSVPPSEASGSPRSERRDVYRTQG